MLSHKLSPLEDTCYATRLAESIVAMLLGRADIKEAHCARKRNRREVKNEERRRKWERADIVRTSYNNVEGKIMESGKQNRESGRGRKRKKDRGREMTKDEVKEEEEER